MNKLKIITRASIYITAVILLSAFTVCITQNQKIAKEKKQSTEKVNCNVLKNCKLRYLEIDDNSTYIIIKDNIHIEFPNGGKNYIKSKLDWLNDCEYIATIIELTAKNSPFKIGDKLNVKFDKIDDKIVYYTATFEGEKLTGKFKIVN